MQKGGIYYYVINSTRVIKQSRSNKNNTRVSIIRDWKITEKLRRQGRRTDRGRYKTRH